MSQSGDTPKSERKLKHGVTAHNFTTEDRRKGAARTAEIRREAAKSFRQRLAERLDEKADEIITTLLAAGAEDWRATVAALDQGFGKPTERTEIVGDGGGAIVVEDRSADLESVLAVLNAVGATKNRRGAAGEEVPAAPEVLPDP